LAEATLVQTRLSIIDLSGGAQPIEIRLEPSGARSMVKSTIIMIFDEI
jgi:hypothetical protein